MFMYLLTSLPVSAVAHLLTQMSLLCFLMSDCAVYDYICRRLTSPGFFNFQSVCFVIALYVCVAWYRLHSNHNALK